MAGQFGKQGENHMQALGKGLVTVVCIFLLSTSNLAWFGGILTDKEQRSHFCKKPHLFCSGNNDNSNDACHLCNFKKEM